MVNQFNILDPDFVDSSKDDVEELVDKVEDEKDDEMMTMCDFFREHCIYDIANLCNKECHKKHINKRWQLHRKIKSILNDPFIYIDEKYKQLISQCIYRETGLDEDTYINYRTCTNHIIGKCRNQFQNRSIKFVAEIDSVRYSFVVCYSKNKSILAKIHFDVDMIVNDKSTNVIGLSEKYKVIAEKVDVVKNNIENFPELNSSQTNVKNEKASKISYSDKLKLSAKSVSSKVKAVEKKKTSKKVKNNNGALFSIEKTVKVKSKPAIEKKDSVDLDKLDSDNIRKMMASNFNGIHMKYIQTLEKKLSKLNKFNRLTVGSKSNLVELNERLMTRNADLNYTVKILKLKRPYKYTRNKKRNYNTYNSYNDNSYDGDYSSDYNVTQKDNYSDNLENSENSEISETSVYESNVDSE